jgi:hypothetical protein
VAWIGNGVRSFRRQKPGIKFAAENTPEASEAVYLAAALRNTRRLDIILITDAIVESAPVLRGGLGWSLGTLLHINEGGQRGRTIDEKSAKGGGNGDSVVRVQKRIDEINSLDIVVYNESRRLFYHDLLYFLALQITIDEKLGSEGGADSGGASQGTKTFTQCGYVGTL